MFGRKVGAYERLLKGQGSNQTRLPGAKYWAEVCENRARCGDAEDHEPQISTD
jgi:hypothetical protein